MAKEGHTLRCRLQKLPPLKRKRSALWTGTTMRHFPWRMRNDRPSGDVSAFYHPLARALVN